MSVMSIEEVRDALVAYRVKCNLTQKQLAKKIGISLPTYRIIELGDVSTVRNTTMYKVYAFLKKNQRKWKG